MVNGTHICLHRDSQISREEMDNPHYNGTSRFVSGNKFNPIYYVYFYGASRWSDQCKLESMKIGDDVFVLGYHPDNGHGELLRFGPDSMEVVEHHFTVKDFHNLRNFKVYNYE